MVNILRKVLGVWLQGSGTGNPAEKYTLAEKEVFL